MNPFSWNSLSRLFKKAHTWTGRQTFSDIVISGGSISGVTIAQNITAITDPATSAAVTTAIIDVYDGVLVTLTGAGNAQTIGNPTTTTTKKIFTVINNDTSTNTITVNSITLPTGKAQSWIWDGTVWSEIDLGITSLPVPVNQGGTGQVSATAAMNALGIPSATAENDFIIAGTSPFAWAKKTLIEAKVILGQTFSTAAEIMTGTEAGKAIAPDQLAVALFHTQGAIPYASAVNTLASLAAGAANFKMFMNAAGTVPEWANGIKVLSFTRAMTASTGAVAYTGFGFKPSALIIVAGINAAANVIGFSVSDSTPASKGWWNQIGVFNVNAGAIDIVDPDGEQLATIASYDADGFTLNWTKYSSPTNTITFNVLAFR